MTERFLLRDFPVPDRADALLRLGARMDTPLRLGVADPARAVGVSHSCEHFGPLVLTFTDASNWVLERTAQLARDVSEPVLIVVIVHNGGGQLDQFGRQVRLAPGSVTTAWSLTPYSVRSPGRMALHHLVVPLALLGLPLTLVRAQLGNDIGQQSQVARLLAHYVPVLLSAAAAMSPAERLQVVTPTVDLVRAVVTRNEGDAATLPESSGDVLRRRITGHLVAHLADPALTAESTAAALGISRRHLYSTLGDGQLRLGEFLRRERLAHAARLLADSANGAMTIAAIARHSGFADHASFSRAFRRRYGCPPTEWRRISVVERAALQPAADLGRWEA